MQKDYTQMESSLNRYSINEEIANSITHGIGIILAMVALGILIAGARITDNPKYIISVSVYGATLILLYTTSTLYHSLQHPRTKYIFQKLDHAAIFLLIAGTYTPITLISLSGPGLVPLRRDMVPCNYRDCNTVWSIQTLACCIPGLIYWDGMDDHRGN